MAKGRLRILSYNIHKGFSSSNRRFVLDEMRTQIRKIQADLVILQEVLGHHEEHGKHIADGSQFEYLADEIWPHYAYGRNAVYSSGHHGNAILSKFPFSTWENIDISTHRLERRGLLHGIIKVPGSDQPIHVISIHLGLLERERQTQINRLCERINSHVPRHEPLIIGGDFNDWRERISTALKKRLVLREIFSDLHGSHARTFPSWLPILKLDRLYFRGVHGEFACCMTGRPWNQLSDHSAIYAELTFGSGVFRDTAAS